MGGRVQPIPGMIPIPGTDTRYKNPVSVSVWKKIGINPVSVRYGGYLGYRYRFGMGDFGHIGIGISVSYRFLKGNICKQLPGIGIIQIYRYHTNISVLVRYGGFWEYRYGTDFLMQYL